MIRKITRKVKIMERKLQAAVKASDVGESLMCVEKREKAAQLGSVRGKLWRKVERGLGHRALPRHHSLVAKAKN